MAFDIITVSPTTVDGAHTAGDLMFDLTSFNLPHRACRLINVFMEVANGGGEDDTKIGILFFKKNTTASLGTAGPSGGGGSGTGANIAHADFTANQYIGQTFLGLSDGSNLVRDVIDTTALYYSAHPFSTAGATRGGAGLMEMVLMTDKAGDNLFTNTMYMGGVVHSGAPDFDGTGNVKIHLHIEH
tara:strand:+ start:707 stop:1264 length:558 start_codon:yes stop_codon:yes gene_type:complete